jgi:hypothetical protein
MGRSDGEDNADLSSDDSPWSDTVWSEDDDEEVRHSPHSPHRFPCIITHILLHPFFFVG